MLTVAIACALLLVATTFNHYEVLRLLAGVEALNGMLLIGWTASYTYLTMERFWHVGKREDK